MLAKSCFDHDRLTWASLSSLSHWLVQKPTIVKMVYILVYLTMFFTYSYPLGISCTSIGPQILTPIVLQCPPISLIVVKVRSPCVYAQSKATQAPENVQGLENAIRCIFS
jgi:hypothetical protein